LERPRVTLRVTLGLLQVYSRDEYKLHVSAVSQNEQAPIA